MIKYPETAHLAKHALEASGHQTQASFCAEYQCNGRTFRAWLAGHRDMDRFTKMVFRQIAKGWHPEVN
jgi:hypothetical protein